jgi:hypothetical protein
MRNEEVIIKAAKIIVDDNNKVYKLSAKQVAYIIYATDGNGTQDRFITNKNDRSPQEWKNAFERVHFTNVIVKPFGTSTLDNGSGGDLDFSEVTTNLYNTATSRPKINYSESPSRENPYAGTQSIPTDSRLGTITYDKTNELQKYIYDNLKSDENRIRAGWYSGSLIDWLDRVSKDPEGTTIADKLEEEFPYMKNHMLERHLVDKQLDFANYKPNRYDISYFNIRMNPLFNYIATPHSKFVDVPENRVIDNLKEIINAAQSFKKHKQYGSKEMQEHFGEHQRRLIKNEDDTKDAVMLLLKGMFG